MAIKVPPLEFTFEFQVTCKCGQDLRGEITVSNVKIIQKKLPEVMPDLSKAGVTVRWENDLTHCPQCGEKLSKENKTHG